MTDYLSRLALALPTVGILAWSSIWLWKRGGIFWSHRDKTVSSVSLQATVSLGQTARLAVVRFGDRDLLICVTKTDCNILATHVPASIDAVD